MQNTDNKKNELLGQNLDAFLKKEDEKKEDCVGEECLIKTDKSIVEKIDRKIITEDGRQLLI